MKAEDIITFIESNEKAINEYKSKLFYDIFNASQKFINEYDLDDNQVNAIYDYIVYHSDMRGVLLYDRFKSLAEKEDTDFVIMYLCEDNRYVVPATQIPKAYFQAIIDKLNS